MNRCGSNVTFEDSTPEAALHRPIGGAGRIGHLREPSPGRRC